MKWLRFAGVTVVIWIVGTFVLAGFAMMECFPHSQQCVTDKRQGAALIFLITMGLWTGSAYLIFRKRPTN